MKTSSAWTMRLRDVYLIDTNVLSEARKGTRADPGVQRFFERVVSRELAVFLSVVTIGELRRRVDLIRRRGDEEQAAVLEAWLAGVLRDYGDSVLAVDEDMAQIWGRLRVPHPENALDKQIAATALLHDLIVVTLNARDFLGTGVQVLNPFHD